ncbi:hypothetical protein [Alkalicoccobacillus gibsonii]|uniref:hypothetical protein n=1 Tax=Alkalicoccobacillus gibsonii TaxID=79881 RepID=UPI00193396E7|nr:hypothetical protein [Alkalicoccobacillus gibsonii]MBM0064764.1 hypothetical protein [Alkalicoccobacillus gibsonii]
MSKITINVSYDEHRQPNHKNITRFFRQLSYQLNQERLMCQDTPKNVVLVSRLTEKSNKDHISNYIENLYRHRRLPKKDAKSMIASALEAVRGTYTSNSANPLSENTTHKNLSQRCHEELLKCHK